MISQQTLKLFTLAFVLSGFGMYSFIDAQTWSAPTATPPGSNASTPINVGATSQTKTGSFTTTQKLSAKDVSATLVVDSPYLISWTQSRANAYCDINGNNCIAPWTIQPKVWGNCPAGQAIAQIYEDGNVRCVSTGGTTTACPINTYSACSTSGASCPSGYKQIGNKWQGGKCSENNDTSYVSCQALSC